MTKTKKSDSLNKYFSIGILLIVLAILLSLSSVNAVDVDVNQNSTDPTVAKTIKEGVAKATTNNSVITISEGTYKGPDNRGVGIGSNTKRHDLIIQSAKYANRSSEDTIIDCEGQTNAFTATISHVKFYGIIFVNGFNPDHGGAIKGDSCNLTIEDCTFINNTAPTGGAVYASAAAGKMGYVDIKNCYFENNKNVDTNASDKALNRDGGALYCLYLNMDNCTFKNNTASYNTKSGGYEGSGGALYVEWEVKTLTTCYFINNSAARGGAIYTRNATMNSKTQFINNTAINGGAIGITSTGVFVNDCIFLGNTALNYGGAIITRSNAVIENSIFENNTAIKGGAFYQNVTDAGNPHNVLINRTNFTNNGNAVFLSMNSSIFSNNFLDNDLAIETTNPNNITINYNRFYKNNYNLNVTSGTLGNVNANLNWWGNNDPSKYTNGIILDNHFIIQLTANGYKTTTTGERLNYTAGTIVSYTGFLVLNDTNVAYDRSELPLFYVNWTNIYNSTTAGDIRVTNLTGSVTGKHKDLYKFTGLTDDALVNLELYFESPFANNTKIEIRNFTGEAGKTIKLNATLKDGVGEILANKNLDFYIYINGSWKYIGNNTTNGNGIAFIDYIPEYSGTFAIQANFTGYEQYKPSTNSSYLIVKQKPTKIEIDDFIGDVGKSVKLNATLKNNNGNILSNKNLTFYIYKNGKWELIGTEKTNSKGIAYIDYVPTVSGKFSIKAEFTEDSIYYGSTNTSKLTVNIHPTKTEINDFVGDIAKTVRLNATLKDKNGDILSGKTLTFYIRINGEWERIGSKKTNTNGIAFINYIPSKAGLFQVRANFSGDNLYGVSSNSSYLTVIDSSLEPTKIQQRNVATLVNTPILLSGILVDKNGEPLGDKDLLFYIQDKNGNWKYLGSSKTFESGRAVLVYTPNETGKFNIRTAFTGDKVYSASTNTSILTVVGPNSPKVTYIDQYDFSGRLYKVMTLNSSLKDKNGKPLAGKPVKFYIDHGAGWLYLGEAITDSQGRAFLNYEPTQMGELPVMTTFEGDSDFIGSSNITILTVKTNTTPPTNNTNDTNDTNKTNKTNKTHGNHKLYSGDGSSFNAVNDDFNLNANGASMKATGLPINLLILVIFSIIGISYRKRRGS